MNHSRNLLLTLISFVLTTELTCAQPQQGQWPPRYDNGFVTNSNYMQSSQSSFQQPRSFRSGWHNNYVNPNYDPYVSTKQFTNQVIQQNNRYFPTGSNFAFYPITTAPLFPVIGNSMSIPPSMMTYNPWLSGYGAMPLQNYPGLYLPMLNFPGWRY
jgi:hypothetical protein